MAGELAGSSRTTLRILREFRRQMEHLRHQDADLCENPFESQVGRTAARLGFPPVLVHQTVSKWMFARPAKWLRLFRRRGLLEGISQFKRAGGKTALVSDYPAALKLKALAADGLFDVVVACGEEDGPLRWKPSPEGLLAAARRLGVQPNEALVIGDRNEVDGEAARRAGMQYCHVGRFVREIDLSVHPIVSLPVEDSR
jgi:HAD superfamily hydrolase (TIGR01549 family)